MRSEVKGMDILIDYLPTDDSKIELDMDEISCHGCCIGTVQGIIDYEEWNNQNPMNVMDLNSVFGDDWGEHFTHHLEMADPGATSWAYANSVHLRIVAKARSTLIERVNEEKLSYKISFDCVLQVKHTHWEDAIIYEDFSRGLPW